MIDKDSGKRIPGIQIFDLEEFKRGMLGTLKVLSHEALLGARHDSYALYKTMQDIVCKFKIIPDIDYKELAEADDERIARMILGFSREKNNG